MTDESETLLKRAERHVAESEARVARQRTLIGEMDRDHHPAAAKTGRRVLAVMEETLRLFHRHLEIIRKYADAHS